MIVSAPVFHQISAALLALLVPHAASASEAPDGKPSHTCCDGNAAAGADTPAPADPYPVMAAGWGPELSGGLMVSRWAEDWSRVKEHGLAPSLKAIPVGATAELTFSGEARLRYFSAENAQLTRTHDLQQAQLRAVVGADLRVNPYLRFYGEFGVGQVDQRSSAATANFQNDLALQQIFVDLRGHLASTLLGAMIGRQEFSDGPRQLISLSDGPNLHRSWNGVRLYAHGARARFGAFDLRATRLGRGAFDETVTRAEKLQGLNASFTVSPGAGPNTYLEPFWIHSENPAFRVGSRIGRDDRDTVGVRLWGRQGPLRFDWTVARQSGRSIDDRRINAWGLFGVQSLVLSESGWKPKLTSHIDVASGGGAYGAGALREFNPLYASSNYLGESQFLTLSNLVMVAPGITLSPTPRVTLSLEYGYAWRLQAKDAVYAGGMRAYPGAQNVPGHYIGGLTRLSGSWVLSRRLTLFGNLEHLDAGDVLNRAGLPSATYSYLSATYRY